MRQLGRLHGLLELGGYFFFVQTEHCRILAHKALGKNAAGQFVVFIGLNGLQHAR